MESSIVKALFSFRIFYNDREHFLFFYFGSFIQSKESFLRISHPYRQSIHRRMTSCILPGGLSFQSRSSIGFYDNSPTSSFLDASNVTKV